MDSSSVLAKTPKGIEEIEQRKHKLDAKLRSVLIMVNGKHSVAELTQKLGQFGDVPAMLEQLAKAGFVGSGSGGAAAADPPAPAAARPGQARVAIGEARTELSRAISAALGPHGDDIAMKIEATKTLQELRAYLDGRRTLLDEVLGKAKSAAFWAKVTSLLG
jgi:hypothetical protein